MDGTTRQDGGSGAGPCLASKLVEQNLAKIHFGAQIPSVFPILTRFWWKHGDKTRLNGGFGLDFCQLSFLPAAWLREEPPVPSPCPKKLSLLRIAEEKGFFGAAGGRRGSPSPAPGRGPQTRRTDTAAIPQPAMPPQTLQLGLNLYFQPHFNIRGVLEFGGSHPRGCSRAHREGPNHPKSPTLPSAPPSFIPRSFRTPILFFFPSKRAAPCPKGAGKY